MIKQVTMREFRGVENSTVSFRTPLTVLVGRNSSGKSTVLDALLVGCSPRPGDAVGRAVVRRGSRQSTAQWLFRKKGIDAKISVAFELAGVTGLRETSLKWLPADTMRLAEEIQGLRGAERLRDQIGGIELISTLRGEKIASTITGFTAFDRYEVRTDKLDRDAVHEPASEVRLVDMRGMGTAPDLTKVWTDASEQDRSHLVNEMLDKLVDGFRHLEIIAVGEGFELGINAVGGTTPLSMSGDGVRAITRLALELAVRPRGLVLIEEPEVHQHPAAIEHTAAVILAAVQSGLQIVVATHSLELIDWLILKFKDQSLVSDLSVQKLKLAGGKLSSIHFDGSEADNIRNVIGTELR